MLSAGFRFPDSLLAGSHSIKHRCARFISCCVSRILLRCPARLRKDFHKESILRVFRSRLQTRETNSPRPGSNVWGSRSGCASPRGRTHRWPRHGSHSARQRHPLASRPRGRRPNPHSRAVRFPPKKAPRERRHSRNRIPHQLKKTPLDSTAQETIPLQENPAFKYHANLVRNRPRKERVGGGPARLCVSFT